MTDRTERIARQVSLRFNGLNTESVEPSDLSDLNPDALKATDDGAFLYRAMSGPRFDFPFFTVAVDYGESPAIRDNEPKEVRLTIYNDYKVQANLGVHWYLPDEWTVTPADAYALSLPNMLSATPVTLTFDVTCPRVTRPLHRAAVEISIEGRPTVMVVPLQFLNGNATG